MSAEWFKEFLKKTNKTKFNVTADTGLDPTTVDRYLNGRSVHKSTRMTLERWAKEHSTEINPEANRATG